MRTDSESKRNAHRVQAGIPATLHYQERDYPANAQSLSRTGTLLRGELPWPSTDDIEITLRSVSGDLTLRLGGRVVHVYQDGESGHARIGVEFKELDANQVKALESILSRVVEARMPGPLALLAHGASVKEIRQALDEIPIPHRITLAARAQLQERKFLRHDTNLQVLEGLARNPNISLMEIKVLARMPQILPSTVALMAEDRRWDGDEELKIILCTHPRAALDVAEALTAKLKPVAVRKVLRSPGLNPVLKTRLLARFNTRDLQGW